MERAAFLSNELPRRGGQSPQARTAFRKVLQQERPKVLQDPGLAETPAISTLQYRQVQRHSLGRARLPQFPEKDNSSTRKVSKSGHEVTGNTSAPQPRIDAGLSRSLCI
jgi:hypothetical protein